MPTDKVIVICLETWAVGGAEIGYKRIASKLPQYDWRFATRVIPEADLVIYSNSHRFYEEAKKLNIPAILRLTGPRSYNMSAPQDLSAVICSSQKGYDISQHPKKIKIYNGVDFEHLKTIIPIACDLLCAPSRIGRGQRVEDAIVWAKKNQRDLTVLGAKQHVQETTYDDLRKKYPWVKWIGLVSPDVASAYIKGCRTYICPTPTHGVSNAIIECVANDKEIINLYGVEIPPKSEIDLNLTAQKYNDLIKKII